MATNEQAAAAQFPSPGEGDSGPLDFGFKGEISPALIPLGATQAIDHIRFESKAIRKDFGSELLGDASDSIILAIGEHGTFAPSGIQGTPGLPKKFLYRIYRGLTGQLALQVYQGDLWVDPEVLSTKIGFGGNWTVINSDLTPPPSGFAHFNADEITLLVHEVDINGLNIQYDAGFLTDGQATLMLDGILWTIDTALDSGDFWTFTLSPGAQQPAAYTNPTRISFGINSTDSTQWIPDLLDADITKLSTISIQDVLAIADGRNPIRLWRINPQFVEDVIDYVGDPLILVDDFEDVSVLNPIPPLTTTQIPYTVDFDINMTDLTGPTSVDLLVGIEVDEGGDFQPITQKTFNLKAIDLPIARLNELITWDDVLKENDVVRIQIDEISWPDGTQFEGVLGSLIQTTSVFNGVPPAVPTTGMITYSISQIEIGEQDSINNMRTINTSVGKVLTNLTAPFPPYAPDNLLFMQFYWRDSDALGPWTIFGPELGPIDLSKAPGETNPKQLNLFSFIADFSAIPAVRVDLGVIVYVTAGSNIILAEWEGRVAWTLGTMDLEVISNELRYAYEAGSIQSIHQITPENFPETQPGFGPDAPVDAPSAKYVSSFGDRLFGLWDEGDTQHLNASADGNVLMWQLSQTGTPNQIVPDDSVNLVLLDNRVDPIDDLIWMKPVSSQVAILARRRSMMRVFETGNVVLGVGATHWQDGVGSLFPYSVTQTEGGLMFLGNNRMVYYMTADQLVPVGADIQEELLTHLYQVNLNALDVVQTAYDPAFQEFYLGINEDDASKITHWWVFDFDRFIRTKETVWRKRVLPSDLLVTIQSGLSSFISTNAIISESVPYPYSPTQAEIPKEKSLIYSDGTRVYIVAENARTIAGTDFEGSWESPTLSRGALGEEATLRTLGFKYSAEIDGSFFVDVSGDGGDTYDSLLTREIQVLSTSRQKVRRVRMAFNVSGYDLRFRIRFPNEEIIKIFSYYPSIVERGRLVL